MSWYDNNENWYKPNYTTHADPVQPDAQRPQAKLPGSRAARIVAIVMCMLLLLGGGTYAVLNSDRSGSGSDERTVEVVSFGSRYDSLAESI